MPENTINPEPDDSDDLDNFDWLNAAEDDETASVEPALTPEDEFALDWMADPDEETEVFNPDASDFDQNFDWTAGLDNNGDDDEEFDLMAALSGDGKGEEAQDSFESPNDDLGWLAELDDSELDLSVETVGDMDFEEDEGLDSFEEPDETPGWLAETGVELEEAEDLIGAELAEMGTEFMLADDDLNDDELDVNELAAGFDLPEELEQEETNWLTEIDSDEPEGRAEIEEEFMLDDNLVDETPVNTVPQVNEDDAESMFPDFMDDIDEVTDEDGGVEWIETLEENAIEVEAREEPDDELRELEGLTPANELEAEELTEDNIEEFDFAGAAAEADSPGWLTNLEDEDFEEDFEEEPDEAYEYAAETANEMDEDFEFAAETGEADEDEGEEFDLAAERMAELDDTPSWLADMQDEDEFEADFEAEVDEAFDFSSAIIDEDEPDEELAFLNNTVGDVKEDTSGYVVDVDSDDIDEEFAFDEASAADPDEMPSWLADVGHDEDSEEADEAYQFSPETADAGGGDFEEEEEMGAFDFAESSAEEVEETPDWLADLEITDERTTPVSRETPDWLTGLDTSPPPAIYEDETDEDTPEWLAELNREEEDEVAELVYDQRHYAEAVDEEAFVGDEIEPASAGNAPDWLNAMVPGLDVDYEAQEDQPIEHDYVRAEAEISGKDPFDWLSEMVEDELSHPPGAIPGVTAASRAARFVFTKPPLWMRVGEGQRETSTVMIADDDLKDDELDFDEIGEDLPPWLSFDDDDIFES